MVYGNFLSLNNVYLIKSHIKIKALEVKETSTHVRILAVSLLRSYNLLKLLLKFDLKANLFVIFS